MSTCPEKDIHSIYIDNELPAAYVAEYEAHVKSCPRCQAELSRLRSLHQAFKADAQNMTLTQSTLDAGFKRLQARLSYSKVTGKNVHLFNVLKSRQTIRSIAGAAVAAAIIAIILPVRFTHSSSTDTPFQPVAKAQLKSPAQANVKVDGAINTTTLSSLFGNTAHDTAQTATQVRLDSAALNASDIASVIPLGKTGSGSLLYGIPVFVATNGTNDATEMTANMLRSTLASYDVFCPIDDNEIEPFQQTNKNQGVSIKFNSALGNFSLEIGSDQ